MKIYLDDFIIFRYIAGPIMSADDTINLLYIDDEKVLLDTTSEFLPHFGDFEIDTAISAEEGLSKLEEKEYDVIISDYQMPGMDGIELLKELRGRENEIPFIIFTGRGREEIAIEALNAGADFYLQKGGDPVAQFTELANNVRQIVEKRRAERSLHTSETEKKLILDSLDDAMVYLDQEYRVVWGNKKWLEMVGKEQDETVGKRC